LLRLDLRTQQIARRSRGRYFLWSAGGPTDVLARALAAKMSEGLSQQTVVDDTPGARATSAARSAPRRHATNQALIPTMPFGAPAQASCAH
jgi:tripartite-type tricarboxylate transporter receptor subunit TctC